MTVTPEAVTAARKAISCTCDGSLPHDVSCDKDISDAGLSAALEAAVGEPHILAPVYKWLVEDVGYPFDFVFSDEKPGWLDLTALAEAWAAHEEDTVENYVTAILSETGWPDAGPLCDECGLVVCICAGGGQGA